MSDAALPPPLLPGLPTLGRLPVLVTGGTGTLGREVVAELVRSQVPARVLSRSSGAKEPGVERVVGDLRTGDGLTEALQGVQAVIHCASDPRHPDEVDIDGTRRLTLAMLEGEPARLVHVSIVGCWDNPFPYYRAKAKAETIVIESGLPHTVVRATQFHSFVRTVCAPRGGFGLSATQLRFAPVDPQWVARTLVDVALADDPVAGPLELAGPEVLSGADIARLTVHVRGGKLRRTFELPAVGGVLKAFSRGSNLPGPTARRGGSTYAQWLTEQD
ncbi:SDR family oxidoreductase [Calidifontibacter terrae]